MNPFDSGPDSISRLLASLPDYEPGPDRAARIRRRCHAALLARSQPPAPLPAPGLFRSWSRIAECAAVGALSAVYLSEVLRRALALYGW